MNHKKIIFILLCFILIIGFYFTPHLAVYSMKRAVETKNVQALSNYVDYPALRESLKANVNAIMAREMKNSGSMFEALGVAMGTAFVNQMVDAFTTPESLAMLMEGENPQLDSTEQNRGSESSASSNTKVTMSYESFNQFIIRFLDEKTKQESIGLIYKRHGVLTWKLSAMRLSLNKNTPALAKSLNPIPINSTPVNAKSDVMEQPLLIPTVSNKGFQELDWERGIYENSIWFDVSWDTSNLNKPTRAIKGDIIIKDIFGEPKLRLKYTITDLLSPGQEYSSQGVGFKYNQFEKSHQWFRTTELKDMIFSFEVTDVIYQDDAEVISGAK